MRNRDAGGADHRIAMNAYKKYDESLKGLKFIARASDLVSVCNWSLGFCALTWASAVLLGAYITDLQVWDFYHVSVLLFVEGLRFGIAALIRVLGIYRIPRPARMLLLSAQVFIPVWLGGFGLLSIFPQHIRDQIQDRFTVHRSPLQFNGTAAAAHIAIAVDSHRSRYKSLPASLTIFYGLIVANMAVLLVGNTIIGSLRQIYVHSHAKSLHNYHDKLLFDGISRTQAGVDLHYAFEMQSFEYKRGKTSQKVCEDYADVIGFLYMHEKGVELAEMALGANDVYVREAAAHMVGFWAVWEKVKGSCQQVPLRYQAKLLSMLVGIAAESYGPTSRAAACSLGLMMEANPKENVKAMLKLFDRDNENKLVKMLVQRGRDVLEAPDSAREAVAGSSKGHLYALAQLARQQRKVVAEEELDQLLQRGQENNELEPIADILQKKVPERHWRRILNTAAFVLINVPVALALGIIVHAVISH